MSKIGIFYGSSTGNTESIAKQLGKTLQVDNANIFDIGKKGSMAKLAEYDVLLLGSSTWGDGDVEDEWELDDLESLDLSGKKVAVFGTGDSVSYSDSFCDALGLLADAAQKASAEIIGNKVDVANYTFDSSVAVVDGFFVGLALDEDNESDQTADRIAKWVEQLKGQI